MIQKTIAILALLAVSGCGVGDRGEQPAGEQAAALPPGQKVVGANGFELTLPNGVTRAGLGERDIEKLAVQVMLDRSPHSPGVIDGLGGSNLDRAVRAYRSQAGLPEGGFDAALLRSLLDTSGGDMFAAYTLTEQDLRGPFQPVPEDMAEQAKLERVGYATPREMLAERFHMDEGLLAALNPGADFGRAGTRIAIVARGDAQGSARPAGEVARIEVRKDEGAVVALAQDGTVLATYPATIGSPDFPSPSGDMEVVGVARDANYTFTAAEQDWGPDEDLLIAAGPNNPVGGIWIELSKDGYGIHGTPDPATIGKSASHGCVRLTNWDARQLAAAVKPGVEVVFT